MALFLHPVVELIVLSIILLYTHPMTFSYQLLNSAG